MNVEKELSVEAWCYGVKKLVTLKGVLEGRRQADLLRVVGCSETNCPKRGAVDCRVGKLVEGKWP